jgi:hypothetical protein
MIINEGEELEITCTSINDINIFYPEDDEIANVIHSLIFCFYINYFIMSLIKVNISSF